jgi:hypothetical protein
LSDNKHMWSKIYREFYHDIVHIANEGFILEYVLLIINLNQGSPTGQVDDFFALVSMKLPYIHPKVKFMSPYQSLEVSIFSHTFSSIFKHKMLPCSWNLTYIRFDIQYLIPNLLVASFYFKIIGQHVCFVKDRACDSGERDIKISANSLEVFHIFLLLSQLKEKSCHPIFTKCGKPRFE